MAIERSRLKRDRILFYCGLILLLAGLPGLALGSLFHDSARIPVVGDAYDSWGWINQTFALLGIFIAVLGVLLLAFSLRGGAIDKSEIADAVGEE